MRSIILAAGKGTRLGKLTQNKPKCLVKILGKPIIEYQLNIFDSCGIRDITLITGYMSSKLDYLKKNTIINKDYETTNMLYSLYCALEIIEGDVIISYGDSVFDKNIIEKLASSKSDISIASDSRWKEYWQSRYADPLSDLETYRLDKIGNVVSLGDEASSLDEIDGQYIGLIKLNKTGSKIFKNELEFFFNKQKVNNKSFSTAYLTDFIQALINKKYTIKSIDILTDYIEIDTIEDLESKITIERVSNFR